MFLDPTRPDGGKMGREWTRVLADVPIFGGLTNRHLARIAGLARSKRFAQKTTIVAPTTPADAFYVILDGRATVRAGNRRVRLGQGDFFGEMALLDGGARSASVSADSEVHTMVIPRK